MINIKALATLGPIGYLPASGTWASLITLFFIYAMHVWHMSCMGYSLIILAIGALGTLAVIRSQQHFTSHDPCEVVIDEVLGCLITFWCVNLTIATAIIGFGLFRFFDISKWCGIRWLERHAGAWGIMLDDVGAGVLSNIILHTLFWFWGSF